MSIAFVILINYFTPKISNETRHIYTRVSVFQSKLLVVEQLLRASTLVVSYKNYTSNYNKYNALPTFERDESFENTLRIIRGRTTIAIKTTNDVRDERKYRIAEIAAKESFSSF